MRRPRRAASDEERVGSLAVHGAEHAGGRRAAAQEFVKEERRGSLGVGALGELLLLGKGVALEPVQQLGAVARDDIDLGEVRVDVDEAGDHQVPAPVVDDDVRTKGRQEMRSRRDRVDHPVAHHEDPVGQELDCTGLAVQSGIAQTVKNVAAKRAQAHVGSTAMLRL